MAAPMDISTDNDPVDNLIQGLEKVKIGRSWSLVS